MTQTNLKYMMVIHSDGSNGGSFPDCMIPLRGETLTEAREYARKMIRGEPDWWSGRLETDYENEIVFKAWMDGKYRAFDDLDDLFEKTGYPGCNPPAVPLLDYDGDRIKRVSIVEFVSEMSLVRHRQDFEDWKRDEEKRLRDEKDRAEYERLKKKFEG